MAIEVVTGLDLPVDLQVVAVLHQRRFEGLIRRQEVALLSERILRHSQRGNAEHCQHHNPPY